MNKRTRISALAFSLTIFSAAAAMAQLSAWTDNTGKHDVQAEFLRLEGDQLSLRKADGKEIAVPLARLSAESQKQAHRLEKEQRQSQEKPLAAASSAGPPPELPPMPSDVKWDKEMKSSVDKAIGAYPENQVAAYFSFREVLDSKNEKKQGPTAKQKAWLEKATDVCRPRALAVVATDYSLAAERGDLRTALVASAIASKINPSGVSDKGIQLAVLKNRIFSSEPLEQTIWKLVDVKAGEHAGAYTEGNAFAGGQISITPKSGYRLVRVKAKVTNTSKESDLPYLKWAFSSLKSVLIDAIPAAKARSDKPRRLASDELIFLVTSGGDWFNCAHVCEGSGVLRQMSVTIHDQSGKSAIIACGGYVEQGDSFDLDVLFTVPKGIHEASLLVVGGPPKLVKF